MRGRPGRSPTGGRFARTYLCAVLAAACDGGGETADAGRTGDVGHVDAAAADGAARQVDATIRDGDVRPDARPVDAQPPTDGLPLVDGGRDAGNRPPPDATVRDAGGGRVDATADGRVPDAGGPADAGPEDAAAPAPSGWHAVAPLAAGPRQEASAVSLGGEVYVLGGIDAQGRTVRTVEAYDPDVDRWRPVADLPVPMNHANVAAVQGRVYVLGFLDRRYVPDRRSYVYDPETDTWSPGQPLPPATARGDAGVAVIGTRIYLLGGSSARAVALFNVYDAATDAWERLPDLPQIRDHMAAGAIDGVIYVGGGAEGRAGPWYASTLAFDPARGEWSPRAPMALGRGIAGGAILDGRLYAFGGEGNQEAPSGVFSIAEAYDPATDRWTRLPEMPVALHGAAAAAVDGRIVVAGGSTAIGVQPTDAVRVFVP